MPLLAGNGFVGLMFPAKHSSESREPRLIADRSDSIY